MRITRGSRAFRAASFALFLAGFSTFSLLYCVQPLLPIFADAFHVSPASSALPMSLATAPLAFAILAAAALSEGWGRRGLMFVAMGLASLLTIAASLTIDWTLFVTVRALAGLVLGGVPAVAMTWLAEELEPTDAARTTGLYVAGTAFGGMSGRIVTGVLTEWLDWRPAIAIMGVLGLAAAIGFRFLLPPSKHFERQKSLGFTFHIKAWRAHIASAPLRMIYGLAFLIMGAFVALYNYVSFRLTAAPYYLGQAAIGFLFLAYIAGMISSSWSGRCVDMFGRKTSLFIGLAIMAIGTAFTLMSPLIIIILGTGTLTFGFFLTHSIASSLVGQVAEVSKGHAASLYHVFYYAGSSIAGVAGGWFFAHDGWSAVVFFALALMLLGALLVRSADINNFTPFKKTPSAPESPPV
ncbi:MAG: hypothetical protein RLZ07_922 [Pseudomonadota bacterium]